MRRIGTMLSLALAIFLVGTGGDALADEGRLEFAAGDCDVIFSSTTFTTGSPESSDISDMEADLSGACDFDDIQGEGVIEADSGGGAVFTGEFEFGTTLFGNPIRCRYAGAINGTWTWTMHNLFATVAPPPVGEDRMFAFTGVLFRVAGLPLFCPATENVWIPKLRIHVVI